MSATAKMLRWFIDNYADPKVAAPGEYKDYQFRCCLYIFESILHRRMNLITMLWARQCGKTETVSIAISAAAYWINFLVLRKEPWAKGLDYGDAMAYHFPDGLQCGFFGPAEDSAKPDYERIQIILQRVVKDLNLTVVVENTQRTIVKGEGRNGKTRQWWKLELKSAAPGSKLESKTFNVLVCEEAQDIERDKIQKEIDPMGANAQATRLRVGTVGDEKGLFYDEITYNKGYAPHNHFEYDYTVPIAAKLRNGGYELWIQQEIAKHGEDSDYFRQKYRLIWDFKKGMLVDELTFIVSMSRPNESRWRDIIPSPLPKGLVPVASLDIASIRDGTVMKFGTADWSKVAQLPNGDLTDKPACTIRFSKTYPHGDFESVQLPLILSDLALFPSLKHFGAIAVDATGERSDAAPRLIKAGYHVLPVVFSGGKKVTRENDKGEIEHGSKFALCVSYCDALSGQHFGYAADEIYMGSLDWFRAIGEPLPTGHKILPPSPEYKKHKHEATNCFKRKVGEGLITLHSEIGNDNEHDDEITADILLWYAALWHRAISLDQIKFVGAERVMSAPGNTFRSGFESVMRIFRTQ